MQSMTIKGLVSVVCSSFVLGNGAAEELGVDRIQIQCSSESVEYVEYSQFFRLWVPDNFVFAKNGSNDLEWYRKEPGMSPGMPETVFVSIGYSKNFQIDESAWQDLDVPHPLAVTYRIIQYYEPREKIADLYLLAFVIDQQALVILSHVSVDPESVLKCFL